MKFLRSKDRKKQAWIEITDGYHVTVKDIPPTWAFGYALLRHFVSMTPGPWPLTYSFLRLDCIECGNTTTYEEAFHIQDPFEDEGQLSCPHCKVPWLTFKYREN